METYKFELVDDVPVARSYIDGRKTSVYIPLSAANCAEFGMEEEYIKWGNEIF